MFTSLRTRFSLLFIVLTLSLLLLSVIDEWRSNHTARLATALGTQFNPAISAVLNADRDLYQARLAELQLMTIAQRTDARQKQLDSIAENLEQASDRMEQFRTLLSEFTEVQQATRGFDAAFRKWQQDLDTSIALAEKGAIDEALAHYKDVSGKNFSALRDIYNAAGEAADNQAQDLAATGNSGAERSGWISRTITLILALLSLLIAYMGPKYLVENLAAITNKVHSLARGDGDLTQRIGIARQDEIGTLARAIDDFIEQLQQMVAAVVANADTLGSELQTLDKVSAHTVELTHKQGQSIELVATAVNQMGATVREVAENAQQTAAELNQVRSQTQAGQKVLEHSVAKIGQLADAINHAAKVIGELESTSENITSVLHVIRDIAEQTNLLALNAAIEAARAGEQGRGFAVVADEVRTLASRTEKSTEDIQRMIAALQAGVTSAVAGISKGTGLVEETVGLSDEAKRALAQISEATERVGDMSAHTATATEEQSQVTEDINRNLSELSELSHNTVALVDDSQSSANRAGTLGQQLRQQVARFKIR
ncbi:methyl-accepting chemotaxis protein [Shewanella cyperi]|uniref:methyl-accepting chemotaxis protein n=1 Tax=Shewanella cyperi TaxID=2814292 RepID=UPI001A94DD8B|nr:methyl-accepting chemotaxis protein [Shewanella cyperi]QSX42474.1 methyl-accepting chemotaxis protein [Shewanella cyperi]